MSGMGVDPAGFMWSTDAGSPGMVTVSAVMYADGVPSPDNQWSVQTDLQGQVTGASGFLASLADLGEYQVVSPREAAGRLNDPRFASGSGMVAYGWSTSGGPATAAGGPAGAAADSRAGGGPVTSDHRLARPGDRFYWPVSTVVLQSARMGLMSDWRPDGAVTLVPAWVLTDDDGNDYTVVAVSSEALDMKAS